MAGDGKYTVRKSLLRVLICFSMTLCLFAAPECGYCSPRQDNRSTVVVEKGVPKIAVNGKVINNMFAIEAFTAGVNAETPQFLSEMKKILDKTRTLNIPVFSFEILWSDYDHTDTVPRTAEEAAGRFNVKNLDAILDYAAELKIQVVLQLLKHQHWALPKWWKSYKNNSSEYQLLAPISPGSEAYNRFQNPVASFGSPGHHELLTALTERLVKRYKSHPAVIAWGINLGPTGENGYAPNYMELMFNPAAAQVDLLTEMADYSPLAIKNFVDWLKRKYPGIEDLNKTWQSGYKSFDEITPPYPKKLTAQEIFQSNGDNRPSMRDWQWFRYEAIVEEWKFLSGLVRRLDPDKLIMGKTNWSPMAVQTGTDFMQISAVPVSADKLIDIDKMDAGLMSKDYLFELAHTSSYALLDFLHFCRFSNKYGVVRIMNLDDSVKRYPLGARIEIQRSLAAKELLKREGCYFWIPVITTDDTHPKTDWSWEEVEELVSRCSTEELKDVSIQEPAVKYYFDIPNLMSQYYDEMGGLKASGLMFSLSKAVYDQDKQPVGYVSSDDITAAPPDPSRTKLLVLANQRMLTGSAASQLKKYAHGGGTLLLLGSNGVFDSEFRKDGKSLQILVPNATELQLKTMYDWGLKDKIKVPFFVVTREGSQFGEIDISGDPSDNYSRLRSALFKGYALPQGGKLVFVRQVRPTETAPLPQDRPHHLGPADQQPSGPRPIPGQPQPPPFPPGRPGDAPPSPMPPS